MVAYGVAVKARLEHQQVLTKQGAPQVGFVLSESALLRMVGDEEIMREQLRHVAEVAEYPHVHLQVLPFRARTYPPGCMYPFTIFRIPSQGNSGPLEGVYLEDFGDGRYRDDHDAVDAYANLWQRFVGASLDLVQSKELVERLAADY